MIRVSNIWKKYDGRNVLQGIQMQINRGDLMILLGESGSGKSTLLKCVSLLEKWDEGEYSFEGKKITGSDWWGKQAVRKKLAYIAEKPEFTQGQKLLQYVLGGKVPAWRVILKLVSKNEHMLAMDFLEKVRLLDKAYMAASKLSGGEKKRAAIARALFRGATVVFADEPVSGLDPRSAETIMEDFVHVAKLKDVTFVCTMQDMDMAAKYATRILGLVDGKIALDIPARILTSYEKNMILKK